MLTVMYASFESCLESRSLPRQTLHGHQSLQRPPETWSNDLCLYHERGRTSSVPTNQFGGPTKTHLQVSRHIASTDFCAIPKENRHLIKVGSMLDQRLRRWSSIDQTLIRCLQWPQLTCPSTAYREHLGIKMLRRMGTDGQPSWWKWPI